MIKIIAITICITGSFLIYASHRHQTLIKQHLPKFFSLLGGLLLLFSIGLLLASLPRLVAVFMWLMTIITLWSLLPFMALLKKNNTHEHDIPRKNST